MKKKFRGKYIAANPLLLAFLKTMDFILRSKQRAKKVPIVPNLIKKVLLSNIAHIGDVIIATCAIEVVKKAYPNAQIDFLTCSSSKIVVEQHPDISNIHILDHFKHNRKKTSLFSKVFQHFCSAKKALKSVKNENYDIAIDLYFFFPNSVYFLSRAHIPTRIGFSSAGFGRLLSHSKIWKQKDQHVVDYYRELFDLIHINPEFTSNLFASLPKYPIDIEQKFGLNEYVIFHPGSGAKHKEWDIEKWRKLLHQFEEDGKKVVFSGNGPYERKMIKAISPRAYNLCSQLTWGDLVELVRAANLVVCVDTSIQHIAAAFKTPCITLLTGINAPKLFSGNVSTSIPLYVHTLCFTCNRNRGCKSMSCIQNITVNRVKKECDTLLTQVLLNV
ncbi:MAG: glycosyltransferase family 9 protein [Rhabdochlamydiaceae bacterium]|nr:glycosyltransferase family 9 protein [Candidatus Amphrikana amoebophyrae]